MKSSLIIAIFCLSSLLFLNTAPSYVSAVAVMSVDLGSEWMKIAIVSPGVPMEIILNTDSQRKTPLVVAFRDGERFVGDSALTVGVRFPEKTFSHFLDLIGKTSLDSIAVKRYRERFPYHTLVEIESDAGSKQIAFVLKDQNQEIRYTPEELLSMLLAKARHYAEVASAHSSPTGKAQTITDCVLTVPAYFSQAERRSLKHSASLAGLKVLQLMNTNAAFALNFGVFRRKDFNATPTNILFYDMGAGDTVATVVSYQEAKTKDRGYVEVNPQLTIKGIGYDRYLGGFEFQLRLRDHLLKIFAEQSKKTIAEISKNKRAMAKLLKEAGRLKKVLSANTEHKAQIENVMNDIDLKTIVTREQFETLANDLLTERVTRPLDDMLRNSGYQMAEIDSFIIIGGATRIPKIQQILQDYFGRDLRKNVNADEGGALGAAYQAAHLSKGFKVKTFHVKDANLFQINVDFERLNDASGEKKMVSRALFTRGNTFPQKKVITFNKHKEDFDFFVNYGDVSPQDSGKNIFKVSLKDVAPIYEKYSSNSSVESKGIKVHFKMDDSGVLNVDASEALFEVEYEEITESDQSYDNLSDAVGDAISKFGSTISKLFSGNPEEVNATQTEESGGDGTPANASSSSSNQTKSENVDNSKTTNAEQQAKTSESANGNNATEPVTHDNSSAASKPIIKKELKKKTVKEPLASVVNALDRAALSADAIAASKDKLKALDDREISKLKRDQAKNTLESFISETRDKLEQEEFSSATQADERAEIESQLRAASEWLDSESDASDSDAASFDEHIQRLHASTKDLFDRVREHRDRPEALGSLRSMLNISEMFYANAINVSEDVQVFNDVELTALRRLVDDTAAWMHDAEAEQASLPRHVKPPKLTIRAIAEKISALDREVKYLLNKARIAPPPKKKPNNDDNDNDNDGTKKDDNSTETPPPLSDDDKVENKIDSNDDKINDTPLRQENDRKPSGGDGDENRNDGKDTVTDDINPSETISDLPPKTEL